ncbi:MAG: hypothetical protein KDC14_04170 [Planctomycetes bacterium]|nr:hypothetical protein [Planctomycetota bacterium]
MRNYRRVFWIGLIVLALVAAGTSVARGENSGHLIWVAVLSGAGALLGALTFAVAGSRMRNPLRGVLVAVLAYHALFGPIMLAYFALTPHSRNEDLPLRLYPHVIAFINSFE